MVVPKAYKKPVVATLNRRLPLSKTPRPILQKYSSSALTTRCNSSTSTTLIYKTFTSTATLSSSSPDLLPTSVLIKPKGYAAPPSIHFPHQLNPTRHFQHRLPESAISLAGKTPAHHTQLRSTSIRNSQSQAHSTATSSQTTHTTAKMAPIALSTLHSNASSSSLDTHYNQDLRKTLKIRGLIPPAVESFEQQKQRCLHQINSKTTSIDKYMYLSNLRNTNTDLFYRLLIDHMKEITPLVYTPVVGEACLKWSHIYTHPEGLYLSWADRGNLRQVLDNWPEKDVEITVVTDGSRILGLGDLGVNGMGIPVGKLALYTGCAGINPRKTLPITLDVGTNNEKNLQDPMYLGAKMKRISAAEQMEFLDEMMIALNDKWPGILVQFEDFKDPFPSLERYRNTYTCFNDDIQGTGAVILGGVMNGFTATGTPLKDHRLVFMGAGSAAVGVARQIVELFIKSGIPENEAKKQIWLVDSKGLVTLDRGDKLADHKIYFARDDNDGVQLTTLEEVVDYVKPTGLMGLCTTGGVFTESILRKMASFNERPIVFPLSNPSHKSECTFEEAMKYTDERVVFASGSPFPHYIDSKGAEHVPGQGNNMYVFPGIGLGALLCKAVHVSQDMIYASAAGLAASLTPEERAKGWLYPAIERIRDVSVIVARHVIRSAQQSNLDKHKKLQWLSDRELDEFIRSNMYDPREDRSGLSSPTSENGSTTHRSSHL